MGNLTLNGSTSGAITVSPPAVAGTNTITLPAATGTLALTGSTTFSSATFTGTTTFPGSTVVDSSGNIGVGTASPPEKLSVNGNLYFSSSSPIVYGGGNLTLQSGAASYTRFNVAAGAEAMRIDSSGNLLVGSTTVNFANSGVTFSKDSGTTKWLVGPTASSPANFYVSAGVSLGVYLAGTSAISWSSASDERLKNIIEPIADGVQKVNTLRAVIGSYKSDEAKTRRPFLIAQDLQKVLPEAVDASNPDILGVQYTEVIPLLVAAIQELSAKNDALEARLAALEAK